MGVPYHSVLWGDYIQPDTPAATALLIRTACQDIPWIPNHLGPPAQLKVLPNPPDVTICDSRPRNLQAVHPCPPHNIHGSVVSVANCYGWPFEGLADLKSIHSLRAGQDLPVSAPLMSTGSSNEKTPTVEMLVNPWHVTQHGHAHATCTMGSRINGSQRARCSNAQQDPTRTGCCWHHIWTNISWNFATESWKTGRVGKQFSDSCGLIPPLSWTQVHYYTIILDFKCLHVYCPTCKLMLISLLPLYILNMYCTFLAA